MIPFNSLSATRHGMILANHNCAFIGRSLLVYGEFSEQEVVFLSGLVKPGDVVLDIGANVGALTVPLANRVGPRGCVVAFEPQRLVYQTLCANVALNSLTNVLAFQYAVGASDGAIRVPVTDPTKPFNFGGVQVSETAKGEAVDMVALDSMALPPCTILKADVEGMEAEVLKGGRNYIAEHQPVLYLEADRGDKRAELLALIAEMGYTAYSHDPPLYNPDNFRAVKDNVFGGICSINLLCLPAGATAPDGLERAT